jgi:hypothetical protein
MKQLLIACFYAAGLMGTTYAQDSMDAYTAAGGMPARKTYLNNISTTAQRDFLKRVDHPTDVKWFKLPDGYIAKCSLESDKTTVAYDRSGTWVYTIRNYPEKKMPRDVRALVKSTYYDYQITIVQEVLKGRNPVVYIVHMQDSTSWKNVRVCDGEMDVLEEYEKRK